MAELKMFSPVLGKEVVFETNGLMGPKHASLEELFYNLPDTRMDVNWIKTDPGHSIVQVTIESTNPPRRVIANGEATTASLNTDIARANPATIAFNRAFDRAVLKFLGLFGVYADSENVQQHELQDFISIPTPTPTPATNIPRSEETLEHEYKALSHKTCTLKGYGKSGRFAPFGWIAQNHPEDLDHLVETNRDEDMATLDIIDPERAESLRDLTRFMEIREKLRNS